MCAIEAGKRGRRVAVLERGERVGKKILISGGGRCNFTNLYCGAENFRSENPHFCKSALARYTPADFVALVEKHKIPYHEKRPYPEAARGQMFCDRSATDIVGMLLEECAAAGVPRLDGGAAEWDGTADLAAARAALRKILPQRLADRWIELGAKRHVSGDWTNLGLESVEEQLHRWQVRPAGTEGYEKAEVTAGGGDTDELSSKTMESRKVRGCSLLGRLWM